MTRRAAGPLDEAEQIHALLKHRFTAPGASEKRRVTLANASPATAGWEELDALIDALIVRMRVDPRPTQSRPRTRDATRPPGPPPVPPTAPAPRVPIPPIPVPETREAKRLEAEAPPPLPPLPPKAAEPVRPPPDEIEAPPIPTDGKVRKATTTLPVVPADQVDGAVVLSRPGNAPETFLLYDDIVTLSTMADREGLLISLERLLVLARLEDHVRQFVESNEVKLMGLYESELKSFSRVPKRKPAVVENTMPRVFLRGEKIAAVLPLVDGNASISEIVRRSSLTPVETCSVLSQLKRAGLLDV